MALRKLALLLAIIFIFANVYCQGEIPDYPVITLEDLIGVEYIIFLMPSSGEYMVVIIEGEYFLVYFE